MSGPHDSSVFLPPGRRTSLLTRPRPVTSCGVGFEHDPSISTFTSDEVLSNMALVHNGRRSDVHTEREYLASQDSGDISHVPLHEPQMSKTPLRRSASKSITSFRSGAHEISSLVRKMSQSLRPRNAKQRQDASLQFNAGATASETYTPGEGSAGRFKASAWFRSQRPLRRPSLPLLNQTMEMNLPRPSIGVPVPGSGSLPPILPDDLQNGAAARAAAAAQNEAFLESSRAVTTRADPRLLDLKMPRDSESGIGIDMRDQSDSNEDEEDVIRQDPARRLPTEILEQIFAYLDPTTLVNAEYVSVDWNRKARSRHVWRHTFHREYAHRDAEYSPPSSTRLPAAGLGRRNRDQDWKKMYQVRRALEQRWVDGQAAAIYLNGHKDSVYCVQFDEQKIITGSRDQTIRIWDARTYQCTKIIGAAQSSNHHPIPPAFSPPLSPTGLQPLCSINTTSRDPIARRNSAPPADFHRASILCLQFDAEIMVTGSSDFTCIVWSVRDNYAPLRRLRGHTAGVLDVCFDDKHIITCSKDTTICVWDRYTGDLVKKLCGHRGPVNAVQLKGNLVVSASGDGVAKLWNLISGLCIKEFPSRDRGLACVEFSDDGKTILAGGNDQVIYQFDANTAELVRELKGHKGLVRSLHLDTVNNRIVSGSYDMSIKVWDADRGSDVTDGGLKLDFEGWTTSWMLAAKSDYRRVVATSQDGRAVILDFGYGLEGVDLLEG